MKVIKFIIILTILSISSVANAEFCGFLRANTAANVRIGPFVNNVDGVTLESSLTITQSDVRVSKNGGPMNAKSRSNACVHDSYGYYWFSLGSSDTDTPGRLNIIVNKTGALMVNQTYQVIDETVYDVHYKDIP